MRRAVTTRTHDISSLCAACARKSLAPSTAPAASQPLQTYSIKRQTTLPQTLAAEPASQPRRWLSSSTNQCAAQGSTTTPTKPKRTHTPLPYYSLFPQTLPNGPPPTGPFTIDTRDLRREFLQLQAASHPDFHHAAASESTRTSRLKAEALSSHINNAYKTLSSPLLRAQYILAERYALDLAGDEASSLTGPADPELLTEVLYAREMIEEAASEKDLEGITKENDERIEDCLKELERAFVEEDLDAAVKQTVRLRYWENIKESLHNWEEGKPVVLQH